MSAVVCTKFTCERCTRVWYVDHDQDTAPPHPMSIEIFIKSPEGELHHEFATLCDACVDSVTKNVGSIAKTLTQQSPDRAKKKD